MNKKISVENFNPDWKNWFQSLHATIWPAVQPWALSVEHVGSTSVAGLAAKPIIDIDIIVKDVKSLAPVILALEKIGYIHRGNLGIEGREAFRIPSTSSIKHNLYVCIQDCLALRNHLILRNFLNENEQARNEYGKLKTRLAESVLSIDEYVE